MALCQAKPRTSKQSVESAAILNRFWGFELFSGSESNPSRDYSHSMVEGGLLEMS
jgi:hypothetical protein